MIKLILELINEKTDVKTLKQIKKMIEKTINKNYIEKIEEDREIQAPAMFLLSTKIIKVNYKRIEKYLEKFESVIIEDMQNPTKEDIQLIKLLTVYRIFLHEIYHSKQIHNAFETDIDDVETEITRSIYNIDRKKILEELKTTERSKIIEYKTSLTNQILIPYDIINPLERKAEIQSFVKIKQMLEPIKELYPKVYDEIYCLEMINMILGYDKVEIPYLKTLEILEKNNPNFKILLPYKSKTSMEFLKKINDMITEREKLELGLKIKENTIQNIKDEISKVFYKQY